MRNVPGHEQLNARWQLARWICRKADFNVFATITLKQAICAASHSHSPNPIKRDHCVQTANIFRDRLSKRFLGRGRVRFGDQIPMVAFVEGNGVVRTHLHFLIERPKVDELVFEAAVYDIAARLDWAYHEIDTRPIWSKDRAAFVSNYCLKTGTDAYLPEASFLRS